MGQYQIARTLMQRLSLAGALSGRRSLQAPRKPLEVSVALKARFMHTPADGVSLALSAASETKVTARWSLGDERGVEALSVGPTGTTWRTPASEKALTLAAGSWRQLVVEFSDGAKTRLCIIDLARTPVLKMKDGKLEGRITSKQERPEGEIVATWKIEERRNELWISGEVFDSDNVWGPDWPFTRDGVQIWLDLRPADRFADINPDRDVSDTLITVRHEPFFSVTPVYWIRPRLTYASACGGVRTETGYRWHYGICGNLTNMRKFDVRTRGYFGFNILVCDNDAKPQRSIAYHRAMDVDAADQIRRLNLLMIVDRKGVFPGTETKNLHLFR